MNVSLTRILLYVQDVPKLAAFYGDAFGLRVVEEIEGEWAVLRAELRARAPSGGPRISRR